MTQDNTSLKESVRFHEETITRLKSDLQNIQPELLEARRQLHLFTEENTKYRTRVNELTLVVESSAKNRNIVVDLENRIRLLENERDHAATRRVLFWPG